MVKKYWYLLFLLIFLSRSHLSMADDPQEKADGAFAGDISQSVVNDSFMGGDVHKETIKEFAGDKSIQADNTDFAGQTYQQQVGNATVPAFAEDQSDTPKDGVFIGEDDRNQTEGSFAGNGFGQ